MVGAKNNRHSVHKLMVKYLLILFTIHYSLFIASCTQDAYDKGEGEYSLLRADFVEAHTNGQKQVDYVITDDGELLSVSEPFTAKWLTKADTLYRCALYYNKVKEDNGKYAADVVSAGQVPCPLVTPLSKLETSMRTDPVKFESAWMSKSGKYINLSLYLMTGSTTDKDAIQHLAIVQDTVMENPDHTRTARDPYPSAFLPQPRSATPVPLD